MSVPEGTEIIIKSLCGWIVITNHSGKEKTMALISRTNPEQQNEIDRLKRENAKLTALLDYVAVMTDVEIPEDEEGGGTDVEEN